jgi:hypothetical protein
MECWNFGMMGLKKPAFKTHIIPTFHYSIRLNKKMAVINTVILSEA